jgi:hypothetical protein
MPNSLREGDSPDLDELLDPKEAARELKCSDSTLAKKRLSGAGPRFVKIGALVRYRRRDLLDYIANNIRRSTSAAG